MSVAQTYGYRQMMSQNDPDAVDVEQYAGETVRLMAHIVGKMSTPSIIEGEVSGSGKTISAHHDTFDEDYRLDTATIMVGESEYRDSIGVQLFTPERFQRVQQSNHAPGPQAGVNQVSDSEDLPDATHRPEGEDWTEDGPEDDDEGGDGEDETPSADDEELISYYRERYDDATADELRDIRGDLMDHLAEARETGQTGNVDELRAKVRAVARELDEREDAADEGGSEDEDEGWNPEPAELREGETEDMSAHARRNLEQLKMLREDGDGDARADGGEPAPDGGYRGATDEQVSDAIPETSAL